MNEQQIGRDILNARRQFSRMGSDGVTNVYTKKKTNRKKVTRKKSSLLSNILSLFNIFDKRNKILDILLSKQVLILGALTYAAFSSYKRANYGFEGGYYPEDGYQPNSGKMSEKGLKELANMEGFLPRAKDIEGEGIYTIGYGHRSSNVQAGQTITKEKALELLRSDIKSREQAVNELVKVPISQNMFDALVSFTYNAGRGSLVKSEVLKKLNAKDYKGAAEALKTQNIRKGGKFEEGLTLRRAKEAEKFSRDITSDNKLNSEVSIKGNTFSGHKITSAYGQRKQPTKGASTLHTGIDLRYSRNEPVYSFSKGTCQINENSRGYGKLVVVTEYTKAGKIDHYYGHLNKILVSNKQKVKAGDVIGLAGSTGVSTGVHLHYGVLKNGEFVDPVTYWNGISDELNKVNKNVEKNKSLTNKSTTKNNQNKSNPSFPTFNNPKKNTKIVETRDPFDYKQAQKKK